MVVASVSCIYGIGAPETYQGMHVGLETGQTIERDALIKSLVAIQYERNDVDFRRGTFRVRGDVVEVFPAAAESEALRVELWGDTVEKLSTLDPLRGVATGSVSAARIYPASHYVTPADQLERAVAGIMDELGERLRFLKGRNRLLEAQRLEQPVASLEKAQPLTQLVHDTGGGALELVGRRDVVTRGVDPCGGRRTRRDST